MKRALILLGGLLGFNSVQAACYTWSGTPETTDLNVRCEAYRAALAAGNPSLVYTVDSCSPRVASAAGIVGTMVIRYTHTASGGTGTLSQTNTSTATTGTCPPPDPCEEEPYSFTAGNVAGPASYCNKVNNCKMYVKSRTGGTMTIYQSAESCDPYNNPPPPTMPDDGPPGGETCSAVGDGEYCASPSGDGQCGYMNDTYICLDRVQDDECKVLGDGGRVCGAQAATTPPVPDNGTPGQLATPDGTISNTTNDGDTAGTTNNYNYYNSGTVGGSSRDPGTDGGTSTGGSPGYGNGESDDGEEGESGCVGETCGESVPTLEDVGTMGEAFTGFWSDLQEVPIVAAADNIAPTFGAGACPTWQDSIDYAGHSIDVNFSSICSTYEDVTPAITIVALVLWGWVAFRILWSA
jgi:hypothetical protein